MNLCISAFSFIQCSSRAFLHVAVVYGVIFVCYAFVYLYICVFVHIPPMEALVHVAAKVINTGDGPGLKEPIDCADSNDCFCNEMILTAEIDHLWSYG